MMKFLFLYLLLINIYGLIIMYVDKQRAIRQKYRVPERILFMTAIFGGSIGTICGMYMFRHKTKHWYFVIGMPLILIIQLIISGFLFYVFYL